MLANIYAFVGLFAFLAGATWASIFVGGKLYKSLTDQYTDWEDYVGLIFMLAGLVFLTFVVAFVWPILIPVAIGFYLKKRKDVSANRNDSSGTKSTHVDDIFGIFNR